MDIEEIIEEEDDLEQNKLPKYKQKISQCLGKYGCKKMQKRLFGVVLLDRNADESDLTFKARQDQYKQ